ncbi:DUF2254 family protein [Halorubrum halophilum]|uniref:DUF2254 family protein n=1 Tax=Halorubrum halophilum TaxID=413816 RepID=UPI00186AEA72|nr:DUF2254 family protein [Halorubrum halophilum]
MGKPLRWPVPAIFAVLAGVSIVAAELSHYDLSSNGQQVFATLASIQAAIFAIVFSVVVLGIQLSTSRYSTRLANLFRSDGGYKKTVGIFVASIGIDVIGLLAFTHVSPFTLRLLTSLALGLAIVSFTVLYFFVDRTLEQTTPEGIIKRVKQELTPQQIISDAEAADDDPSETDPFLVPVSIVRSAIDDRDVPAVTRGLNVIDNHVEELLKFVSTEQVEDETPVGDSLEELCTNRLPSAGEKAADEDLGEAGSKTVDTLSSVGSNAVEQSHGPVVVHSSQGLGKLISNVNFETTGEKIRKEAVEKSTEVLTEAAEAKLWDATGTGTRVLGWRAAQSVMQRGPTENFDRPYTSLILRYLPSILKEVVEGVPDDLSTNQLQKGLIGRDSEHATSPEQWALWCCYAAMSEATSSVIRYELNHGEEIVKWERAGNGWSQCISTLENSNFDYLLRLWLGTLLYIEYISFETDDQHLSDFHSSARFDVSRDTFMQTIDDILQERFDPRSRVDLLPGYFDPIETPQTGYPAPPLSDADRTFEEWLKHQKKIMPDSPSGWGISVERMEEEIKEEIEEGEDGQEDNGGDVDS